MTSKKPFVKWVLHGIELPLHQNLIHWPSPIVALEQSLRTIWHAASWAAVLILPQIKLTSQLSSCISFLADSYGDQWSEAEWTLFLQLDSTKNQSFGMGSDPLHPSASLGMQMNLGKSLLVLESPVLVEILSFIWRWRGLPAPSH